jgi:hypothetical protein
MYDNAAASTEVSAVFCAWRLLENARLLSVPAQKGGEPTAASAIRISACPAAPSRKLIIHNSISLQIKIEKKTSMIEYDNA